MLAATGDIAKYTSNGSANGGTAQGATGAVGAQSGQGGAGGQGGVGQGSLAGNGYGATGGTGGNGGALLVDAGSFNMSNVMSGVGQSAAGIMAAVQNSGISSLVQQAVNVQANLAVGK